jgi:hypothetical protein
LIIFEFSKRISMPAYGTRTPTALYPGDSSIVWANENPLTGAVSLSVAIGGKDGKEVDSLSVEVAFTGAPGAFEIDIQDADSDDSGGTNLGAGYNTITAPVTAKLTAVNAQNVSRFELAPFKGLFARLIMVLQNANAVNIKYAKFTR